MAATTATSKVSPVVLGSGRMKSTTYIATKVTGPIKDAAGSNTFATEIVQYDDAKGGGAKTIGTRDAATGEITWNDNASNRTKLNESQFKKASNNQMQSIENELVSTAAERAGLNAAAGRQNEEVSEGNQSSRPLTSALGGMFKGFPLPGGGGGGSDVARQSYNKNLCYPTSLRRTQQDCLRISVLKYRPPGLSSTGASQVNRTASAGGKPIGSVTLPIPGGINDKNVTKWGPGTMTPVQMAAAGAVKAFLGEEGAKGALDSLETSLNAAMGESTTKDALSSMFTENLTGATDVLSRTTGSVLNPNMELLFQGPSLRTFTFTFRMSPRDERESVTILRIIRMFKQSMAPQKTPTALFLKAPNTYRLEYITPHGGRTHKFLPKIKECAMVDFGVNYTPDGNYMTYDNSSMIAYEMAMTFQEIEPIYNNDMNSNDSDVGY